MSGNEKTEISAEEKRILDLVEKHYAEPLRKSIFVILGVLRENPDVGKKLAEGFNSTLSQYGGNAIGRKYLKQFRGMTDKNQRTWGKD